MRKLILLMAAALPLMAATGDVVAVRVIQNTCTAGASCNGWVAEIDLEGLSTGGTYDFGLGANNNPSTAKIVFTVTSPGYTTSGSSTTIVRTVYGTTALRKPYPDEASKDETAGTPLTVRVALSDFIYSGDTATVSIASGFYAGSNAVTGLAVTNNSTRAYPKPVGRWALVPYTRETGNFVLEATAFHRHARNGKPVAAVKYACSDEHSNTVNYTVNDMTVSSRPDPNKVLVYAATVNVSTLTQGDVVTCNFVAYPWVGDSTSLLNSDLVANGGDGVAQPNEMLGPFAVLLDKTEEYGLAFAVVDATNGQASNLATWVYSSQAAAEAAYASDATNSYANVGRAVQALKAYNNANYGRNEPGGGTMLLVEGTHTHPGTSPGSSLGASKTWVTITRLSTATKANVILNGSSSTLKADKEHIYDINLQGSSGLAGRITDTLWVDQLSIDNTNTNANIYAWLAAYATHNSIVSMSKGFGYFSTNRCGWALIRGNSYTQASAGTGIIAMAYNVIGNTGIAPNVWMDPGNAQGQAASDNVVVAYNKAYNLNGYFLNAAYTAPVAHGLAVVQNVVETVANQRGILIAGDSSSETPVDNVLMWHNSAASNGSNLLYNDNGSTALYRTGQLVGNIFDRWASKTDNFSVENAARTGNWPAHFAVGYYGNHRGQNTFSLGFTGLYTSSEYGMVTGTDGNIYACIQRHVAADANKPITGANWEDYWVLRGAGPVTWGWTSGYTYSPFGYVDDASYPSGDRTGLGDYHLTSSATALSMIPANMAVLPYDLDGVARKNDGTGAAGAYEYQSASGRRKVTIIQ